jgi:hypothetical protein
MTEFQALITGAVAAALTKASAEGPFLIDVEIEMDEEGNYTNRILVTGQESGEELLVTVTPFGDAVEPLYDTPESVEEKMQGVHAMREAAARHGIELA